MYDLDFLKSQRRKTRTEIKRYLIAFRDDIVTEFNIELPTKDEIRLMKKEEFDEWIVNNYSKFTTKEEMDLQLIEMLESFICVENNILNLENAQSVIM